MQAAYGVEASTTSLLQIDALKFSQTEVEYAREKHPAMSQTYPTTWNMKGMSFVYPKKLDRWTYLRVVSTQQEVDKAGVITARMVDEFVKSMTSHGMQCTKAQKAPQNKHVIKYHPNDDNLVPWLEHFGDAKDKKKLVIRFLLVILPDDGPLLYERIKLLCERMYGIRSQMVQQIKFMSGSKQIYSNVAAKVNSKLGGTNCFAEPASLDALMTGEYISVIALESSNSVETTKLPFSSHQTLPHANQSLPCGSC